MTRKRLQESTLSLPVPHYGQEEWIVDISSTVAKLLSQLETLNHATIVRDDIGIKFSAYYNYKHVVKIDLTRLDKKVFFALPLPVDNSIKGE